MKQCITCASDKIVNVVEGNRIFYYCKACQTKNLRYQSKSNQFATKRIDGNAVHNSIAALIRKNDKYLFINRNDYPFGYSLPVGHIKNGESLKEALNRKVIEETGLIVTKSKLIANPVFSDCCKYGTDLHLWNVFECSARGKLISCFEVSEAVWVKKKDICKLDLTAPNRYILSKIGLIEKDYELEERLSFDSYLSKNLSNNYTSIIRKIPFPILIFDETGTLQKTSATAEKMLLALKNKDRVKYNEFMLKVDGLIRTAIEIRQDFSKEIEYMDYLMRAEVGISVKEDRLKEISISLEKIEQEEDKEKEDFFAYQSTLALCTKSNHMVIIRSILKQMVSLFNLNSASLMLKDKDIIRTSIKISKNNSPTRRPLELKIGEGVAGWVAKNKKIMAVSNTLENPIFIAKSPNCELSLLSVPVISDNTLLAVLNIAKEKNTNFTEYETRAAIMVANRIALALVNKKLYDSLQKDKKTLEGVLNITNSPISLIDKDFNVIFKNPASRKLGEDINENTFKDNDEYQKFCKTVTKTFQTGKTRSKELKLKVKNKELTLKSTFSLFKEGSKRFVLIGSENITKVRQREKTIQKQIQVITELFKITSISTNGKEFFEKISDRTKALLDSKYTKIIIFNDHFHLNPKIPNIKATVKLLQEIVKDNHYHINNNISNPKLRKRGFTKAIVAPIVVEKKTIGAIFSLNKKTNYNSQDMRLISIIASRISRRLESLIYTHEITENKKSLSSIIDNSGDGILVIDDNKNIHIWNKAAEVITGYNTGTEFLSSNKNIQSSIFDGSDALEKRILARNADNEKIWIELITTKNDCDLEKSNQYIVVMRDVTKEISVEQRQKEFIYTATHELRTPITAIKGYLSMILAGDAGKINPQQEKYFSRVYSASGKLNSLVEDLLNVARLEENRTVFEKTNFEVSPMVDEILTEFKQKANTKNIKLFIEEDKKIAINGDVHYTKQALANLVDNAIKYTHERGTVTLKIKEGNELGEIEVVDNGVGISRKDQALIFNKFHRANNSETIRAGGTGLGLFIVKNLIEKQGGKIEVVSKLGIGSTFKVALPLAK